MPDTIRHYFATLARYHVWATTLLLQEVARMDEQDYQRDAGLFFKSVHGTLNHMLVGELHWHSRFADGVSLAHRLDAQLETDRASLAAALQQAVGRWRDFVPALTPAQLAGDIHYTRATGQQVTTPFAATLGHVFNHGTHHRGQLSAALTCMGYPCPELDMIYMLQADRKA